MKEKEKKKKRERTTMIFQNKKKEIANKILAGEDLHKFLI